MRVKLRFVTGALLALAPIAMGCSVAPQAEPQQSSQSKLLAPKALLEAKASASTTKETGITEWRVFRGKKDFILTGYDSHGKSVGGTAFRFAKDGGKNVLGARVLDGSSFSAKYTFGGSAAANATANAKTQKLFHHAAADMLGVRLAIQAQGRGYQGSAAAANQTTLGLPPGLPAGLDPFGGLADPFGQLGTSCGADLTSMLLGALQCVSMAGGLAAAQTNPAQLLQCALASQGAATSVGTCQNPAQDPLLGQLGGMPLDPTQLGLGTGMDPYGMQDPFGLGMGAGMDPYGQMGGMDPYGQGADPYGMGGMDPYGMGVDPYGQGQFDPLGQGDPFGQQQCLSCVGGYDDFGVDPMSGGVGFDPAMGGDPGMGGYEGF